jgi:hypothetical protein
LARVNAALAEANAEIERQRAEIESLKPTESFVDKPWKALPPIEPVATDFDPSTHLVDLEKHLTGLISQMDLAELAAADLICHMVKKRGQHVKNIAKLINRDPKWVKAKLEDQAVEAVA